MAGLPKRKLLLLIVPLLLAFSACVSAQETQMPSSTLQPILDAIQSNPLADETQTELLVEAFSTAIESELLSTEQAVAMLEALGWSALEQEGIGDAIARIDEVIAGVASGEIDDPIAALTATLEETATPEGIINALANAGATEAVLSEVENLVGLGLPPGIVLRVTKDALREGASEEEIVTVLLPMLADAYATLSPGQAANLVTGQGTYQYTEQEEEQNANKKDDDGSEKEKNKNGPRETGNGNAKGNDKGGKKS